MDVDVLGIDLGKNSCSVVGLDPTGRVVLRRRMRRESIVALAAKLSAGFIGSDGRRRWRVVRVEQVTL